MKQSFIAVSAALVALSARCTASPPRTDAGDASDVQPLEDATFDDHADAAAPLSTDEYVRACVVLVSCPDVATMPTRIASCVQLLRFYADAALVVANPAAILAIQHRIRCALDATDCRAFSRCATLEHGPTWCQAHPGEHCDNNAAIECPSTPAAVLASNATDCASLGQVCRETANQAICSTGTACSSAYQRCEGARRVSCTTANFEQSIDCSRWPGGGTCQVTYSDGGLARASCVPTAGGRPLCTSTGGLGRCEGSILHGCLEVGVPESEIDCAALGARCEIVDGGRARCVPSTSECSDDTPDRCEGATLATCVDGRWRRVACASVWRSQCVVNDNAARCAD